MKMLLSLLLVVMMCFPSTGCGEKPDDGGWPYTVADVTKDDLMWDTDELFGTVPETKSVGYTITENIEAFKFKSAGYLGKENTWVYAVMGTPKQDEFPMPDGGYPAVVLVHGGGGQVYLNWVRYWNEKGFVAIAFDTYGNMLDADFNKTQNPEGGPSEACTGSIMDSVGAKTDSWVYHVVTNVILCNNILRNREDVNKDKIVATGISWGSVALCITSGVDKRFAGFAPVYGGGYVYDDSFFVSNYPSPTAFGGTDDRDKWIALYDASSYLPYSTKPMFFVSGIDDIAFSVTNRVKLHALPKGKVFYCQRSDLGHGHVWKKTNEIYYFFRHILYNEDISMIDGLTKNGNTVTLEYSEKLFDKVTVIYTSSTDEDSHKWVFSTDTVEEKNGKYSYELPENVTAYAFETEHSADGYKLSTSIYIVD